jgi:hypothetical protein
MSDVTEVLHYVCPECEETFELKPQLGEHLLSAHVVFTGDPDRLQGRLTNQVMDDLIAFDHTLSEGEREALLEHTEYIGGHL